MSTAGSPDDVTKGPQIVRIVIVFQILSVLAVALRIFTRTKIISGIGTEDYLLITALFVGGITTACQLLEVKHGAGRHANTLTLDDIIHQLKYLYFSILAYGSSLALVKVSLVLQYLRIFVLHYPTRVASYAILAFVALYSVSTMVAAALTCLPVSAFWNVTIHGRCLNRTALWFTHAAFGIFTDFAILLTPMPALISLHLPRRQKIGIMVIFAGGSFACITSILRLYYLHVVTNSKDVTWDNSGTIIWSSIEISMFLVCASATGLKPLYSQILSRNGTEHSYGSRLKYQRREPASRTVPTIDQDARAMKSDVETEIRIQDDPARIDRHQSKVNGHEMLSSPRVADRQESCGQSLGGSRKSTGSERLLIHTST